MAVVLMINRFIERYGLVKTIGIGNEQNDIFMLELMDKPILGEKDDRDVIAKSTNIRN